MTREQKIVLYVVTGIARLEKAGLISGGANHFKISKKADKEVRKMEKEGFEPSQAEIESVIRFLESGDL